MFQGLLKRAERSIDSAVTKVIDRALVAAPLIVAGGFATAALTVWLVEHYGHVLAYALMAGAFALIGLITMAVLGTGTAPRASSESAAPEADETAGASDEDASSDMDLFAFLTPEVRAILTSAAPVAVPGIARGVTKNLPLILLVTLIGFVVSRFAQTSRETPTSSDAQTSTGSQPPDQQTASGQAPPSPAPAQRVNGAAPAAAA